MSERSFDDVAVVADAVLLDAAVDLAFECAVAVERPMDDCGRSDVAEPMNVAEPNVVTVIVRAIE